jgi:serine/threonine-protein kinase HipA
MRRARVFQQRRLAGIFEQLDEHNFRFSYEPDYEGEPVSLTMPLSQRVYEFDTFPSVFEGLLPEGVMLEGLLRRNKIDRNDLFTQLLVVGNDVVGSLQIVSDE